MIEEASSYFTENGNTGYHDLTISYIKDGKYNSFQLRTGVEYEPVNFLLCKLDDILEGELTETKYLSWQNFKNRDDYVDIVTTHDTQLLEELKLDLESKTRELNEWFEHKGLIGERT